MSPRRAATLVAMLAAAALAAGAREVPVVLLHTTDLHGRIVNAIPSGDGGPETGLLRLATLIRTVRAGCPDALYVDCGDTIQGTPESLHTRGRVMVDALAALRCDAWVPGNHEFDWGLEVLRGLVRAARFPVLAANVSSRTGAAAALPGATAWTLREAGGVRIAFVGTTHPGIPGWLLPEILGDVEIGPSTDAIRSTLPEVRAARPDILVLLVHESAREDPDVGSVGAGQLAARFPEFDVILGGHSHEAVAARSFGGTLYAQAGCHGAWLGRVDLLYDTVQGKVVRKAGSLVPVDGSVPPDPELAAALGPALEAAHRDLDRIRASVREPLDTAPEVAPGDEAVARMLRAAIAAASGAEVVIHARLSGHAPAPGAVTERDVWRIVPYENRIGLCHLTAGELKEVLEEALAQPGDRPVMGVSGLRCDMDPSAPAGRRVVRLVLPDGRAPHARQRFVAAFNSHVLATGGRRFPVVRRLAYQPESRFALTPVDTRDAVRRWLEKRKTVGAADLPPPGYRVVTRPRDR
jgi:2',3'-cyclic-nucleotide 2'-phosphodiesterase/3'-nucleotidase